MAPDRLVPAGDLVLQSEIAERLHINPTKVANLAGRKRSDTRFPCPVKGRGNRGIWLWSEIEDWYYNVYYPTSVEGLRAAAAAEPPRPRRRAA